MSTSQTPSSWTESSAQRWLADLDVREASLAPVLDALLSAADLQPGERVLDVGCGAGPSTMAAADRVSPGGQVTGVDISAEMIEAARRRAEGRGIRWLVADAQDHRFPAASYDVVLSRFGLMFFADPSRAFANFAAACRPGGRLVVTVWPVRDESAYFARPLAVLTEAAARLGVTLDVPPSDGGPFSLGYPEGTRQLLAAAGWADIEIRPDDRPLSLSGPGGSAEQALDFVLALGPSRSALESQPAEVVDTLQADLLAALRAERDDTGVALPGGFLVVSARRP